MRLGFITPRVSLSLGGIENISYLFVEAFNKQNTFYTFCAKDSETVDGYAGTMYCSRFLQKNTLPLHISLLKMLFSHNAAEKFDFTFSSLYSYGAGCLLLKKIYGVPYGILAHGNELMDAALPQKIFGKIKYKIKKRVRNIILENADIIFANSGYTRNLCIQNYKNKNVTVIHPPVKFQKKSAFSQERTYSLLSVGRLVERKGFQYVIKAMPDILKNYPDMKYFIAGDGPYKHNLQKTLEELGLQKQVLLLGKVSEQRKEQLYRECDFFIMPSYTIEEDGNVEGFGIVFIEANLYGKFVITTRSGGIPDAVNEGETGIFVECQNEKDIAEAVNGLYGGLFSYSADDCIAWAKRFDVDNIVNSYVEKIKIICDKANRASN